MATQKAIASYQEIIDLHTESDTVSVLGIHTPVGSTPRKMFPGFFTQFKKFKYLGCSISLVPAARLPADPLQVSYEPGEPTIDPRDMLNPIMFHGCHGNDLGAVLNKLYGDGNPISDSVDLDNVVRASETTWNDLGALENLYYKALTDNSWRKAHPQRGFRKSGLRPLVYSLAANRQIAPGSLGDVLEFNEDGDLEAVGGDPMQTLTGGVGGAPIHYNVKNNLQLFTPRLTGLGWLDTRNVMVSPADLILPTGSGVTADDSMIAFNESITSDVELPLIYMGLILMPPAYKQEQYYRMIINHSFAFKGFRSISFQNNIPTTPSYFDINDEQSGGDDGGDDPSPPDPQPPLEGITIELKDYNFTFNGPTSLGTFFLYDTAEYEGVDYQIAKNLPAGYIWQYSGFVVPVLDGSGPSDGNVGLFISSSNGAMQMIYNNRYYSLSAGASSWTEDSPSTIVGGRFNLDPTDDVLWDSSSVSKISGSYLGSLFPFDNIILGSRS